jgi:hypothetical protein
MELTLYYSQSRDAQDIGVVRLVSVQNILLQTSSEGLTCYFWARNTPNNRK